MFICDNPVFATIVKPSDVKLAFMTNQTLYPTDVFFDIETLVNVAQPSSILLLGNQSADFLDSYLEQKLLLNQPCEITQLGSDEIIRLKSLPRHDVAIVIDLFEHIDKAAAYQVLSALRDLLSRQYCICLPLAKSVHKEPEQQNDSWCLTELFSFALERVAIYSSANQSLSEQYGLFKYNINDYKKTPEWLNSDNWANPEMWGKYWW